MKNVLQILALLVCLVAGIWMAGHGINVILSLPAWQALNEELRQHLVEGSFCLVGGVGVLAVAVQQFFCWRTHRKQGDLL